MTVGTGGSARPAGVAAVTDAERVLATVQSPPALKLSSQANTTIRVVIYTRPGCHLCDNMKATVRRVAQASPQPVAIEEIDISSHPELERLYGQEIPVLF